MHNHVKLENDFLELHLIPNWGSNTISLLDKRKNLHLLRQPASEEDFHRLPFLYGIPVLFPPNRIEDGRFTFRNRTYLFDVNEGDKHNHLHGLVYDKPWEVIAHDSVSVTTRFDSKRFPKVEDQFPHHFVLELTTSLHDNRLIQTMQVQNLSDSEMPLGLGYHTTFTCSQDIEVMAPVTKRWELNERQLPTGVLEDVSPRIRVKESLDDAFLVNPNVKNELLIIDRENGVQIQYVCDRQFTQWVIYNKDGKSGFLCTEPYTWITNAPNLDAPASLTGFQTLQPGGARTFTSEIVVTHLPA